MVGWWLVWWTGVVLWVMGRWLVVWVGVVVWRFRSLGQCGCAVLFARGGEVRGEQGPLGTCPLGLAVVYSL